MIKFLFPALGNISACFFTFKKNMFNLQISMYNHQNICAYMRACTFPVGCSHAGLHRCVNMGYITAAARIDLTLSLLPKAWNVKLSTDGTYRLLLDSYTLVTLSMSRTGHLETIYLLLSWLFRSRCVLANKVNEDASTSGTWLKIAHILAQNLKPQHFFQRHGYMHLAIEAARHHAAHNATRFSDCRRSHVTRPC